MIPVNRPLFISNEKEYLARCIDEGWVSSEGPYVAEFEERFAKFCGRKYGVAVSSGTAALEIAMGALGLKPGDEVIMPTFTIISCPLACIQYGLVPVFVDADPQTWTIDTAQIEERITKNTKAIMPVHIYGHPCDMDPILHIAKKYRLKVIEDAAEAHGAEYKKKKCGSFGDISCFSFYANKIISTGEGGMVLMDKKEYMELAKLFRNLGFDKERKYIHEILAKNYRMTNLQAALGVAQVKNIQKLLRIKRRNGAYYTKKLQGVKGLQLPVEMPWARNVYWMYGIVLDESTSFTAEKFAKALAEKGIGTRYFFYPLHCQPVFQKMHIKHRGKYAVAERLFRQGLYLPSGLGLTFKEIDTVCDVVKRVLA